MLWAWPPHAIAAVLLLIPLLISAHPESATKYLIDEPASMMDIGLLRMKLDLTEFTVPPVTRIIVDEGENGITGLAMDTQYDYANDMIIVRVYLFGESEKADQKCKSTVSMFVGPVKRELGDWFESFRLQVSIHFQSTVIDTALLRLLQYAVAGPIVVQYLASPRISKVDSP